MNDSDALAIESWIALDWHETLGFLDHRLRRVGFGSYREADPGGFVAMTAVLDVKRGRDGDSARSAPAVFPGAGVVIPAFSTDLCLPGTACSIHRYPGELQTCGFYEFDMGLPIVMQFGGGTTPAVSNASLTSEGTPIQVCAFTAETYRYSVASTQQARQRSLRDIGAVVILPRFPLGAGRNYTVAVTVNGQPYQWTFRVQ